MRRVDMAVFAHNEKDTIALLLGDLSEQSVLAKSEVHLAIHVLCNGCSDNTPQVAQDAIARSRELSRVAVVSVYAEAGKSLTWNKYVASLSEDCDTVVFLDGDIRIADPEAILNLVDDLAASDSVSVTSRPSKNLLTLRRRPVLRLSAGLTVAQHRDGPICGQLYAVRAHSIRRLRLPVPCLVDDGFLSACLVTGLFSHDPVPRRVKASFRVSHSFDPPVSLGEFFRHDMRIRLGAELNAALYSDLWAAPTESDKLCLLYQFSRSEGIEASIREHLRHPERSALSARSEPVVLWEPDRYGIGGALLRLPFRVAYRIYRGAVRRRARQLFAERRFWW